MGDLGLPSTRFALQLSWSAMGSNLRYTPVTMSNSQTTPTDILNHHLIGQRYFFPRPSPLPDASYVDVTGARLGCWRSASPSTRPLLVHFHGNGELVHDWRGDFSEWVHAQGFDLYLAEYRGYGASSGTPQLGHMLDDVAAIAAATGTPPQQTVVFGRSVGSLFAIEWVRRFPETRGLVIESGIHDVSERLELRIAPHEMDLVALRHALSERVNHARVLEHYPGPSLFIHAEQDQLVGIAHAECNVAATQGRGRMLRLSRGGHNTILAANVQTYLGELRAFLQS